MKKLDFIIIGAQKAGTTALFRYLRRHPRIYMPLEKEIPFFSDDVLYARGWEQFARRYYGHAPPDRLWGKATPRYMIHPDCPSRIRATMPDTRLIALLRDPIERCISHYKMARRRGAEVRPIDEVVNELLRAQAVGRARAPRSSGPLDGYLERGEYATLLQEYLDEFPGDRLLVLFTEQLASDPESVLDQCLAFLGLPPGFRPPNLQTRYHVGGTRRRIRWLNSRYAQACLRRIPGRMGEALRFGLETWNAVAEPNEHVEMSDEARRRLVEFYRPDVERLQRLLGRGVPWPRFDPASSRVDAVGGQPNA